MILRFSIPIFWECWKIETPPLGVEIGAARCKSRRLRSLRRADGITMWSLCGCATKQEVRAVFGAEVTPKALQDPRDEARAGGNALVVWLRHWLCVKAYVCSCARRFLSANRTDRVREGVGQ